jgi:hypothetical protein
MMDEEIKSDAGFAGHSQEDVTRTMKQISLLLDVVCLICLCFAGFHGNGSVAAGLCGFCWVVKT